ncbi:FAD-dependent oxidoreductase [Qipengyuania sp. YG27]|uniref:FAD-dependent oxidoreductase n=1 Tax=Qipengyuania mesophila TaxID=2867246 RepID=A0ABS7JXD1_9SPHN|nr:FAD-dependent oxidoreductase [Qipengyuania mesophila]
MIAPDCDVAIIGAGPAGAALAIHLRKAGRSVVLVEKESFPRHHIGESLTGECVGLLDELGMSDHLRTAAYPVKRGVTVTGANSRARFWVPVEACEGSSRRPATTWQVRRDEFDAALLDKAVAMGAELVRGTCRDVTRDDGRVTGIVVRGEAGDRHAIASHYVADCSGQKTFLAGKGLTGPKSRTGYENQTAVFAQVRGLVRDPGERDGSTHIFYGERHHWAWSIPLSKDVTSLGIVLPKGALRRDGRDLQQIFRDALGKVNGELIERSRDVELCGEVETISNYSYSIENFTGPGFLCVGDSHRFFDPIFSFGVLIALQEARLAAQVIDRSLADPAHPDQFDGFVEASMRAQRVVEYVIRTFWDYPFAFLRLAHFTHQSDIAEIFSGRLYTPEVMEIEAVRLMREMLHRTGQIAA